MQPVKVKHENKSLLGSPKSLGAPGKYPLLPPLPLSVGLLMPEIAIPQTLELRDWTDDKVYISHKFKVALYVHFWKKISPQNLHL